MTNVNVLGREIELYKWHPLKFEDDVAFTEAQITALAERMGSEFASKGTVDWLDAIYTVTPMIGNAKVMVEIHDDEYELKGDFTERFIQWWEKYFRSKSMGYYSAGFIRNFITDNTIREMNDVEFAITDRIDWEAGDYSDEGSCWFSYLRRGLVQFKWMARHGKAYALLFNVDGDRSRAWFIPYQDQWIMFNLTSYERRSFRPALARFLGCNITSMRRLHFSPEMHVNGDHFVFHSANQTPILNVDDPGWSDYAYDDYGLEREVVKYLLRYAQEDDWDEYGDHEVECDCCGMPRLYNESKITEVKPHGEHVCKWCYNKLNVVRFNSKLWDTTHYEIVLYNDENGVAKRKIVGKHESVE